jgi:hypothetical protein
MSVNGFNEADLRNLPAATIRSRLTLVQASIAQQLVNGTSIASYSVNGRSVTRTSLEFLTMYEAALYRALQLQSSEPDGLGIGLARFGEPESGSSGLRRGGF